MLEKEPPTYTLLTPHGWAFNIWVEDHPILEDHWSVLFEFDDMSFHGPFSYGTSDKEVPVRKNPHRKQRYEILQAIMERLIELRLTGETDEIKQWSETNCKQILTYVRMLDYFAYLERSRITF